MRKILLAVAGVGAVLVASGQIASAKDNHHVRRVEQQQRSNLFTDTRARNANAQYIQQNNAPNTAYQLSPQQSEAERYANGFSAPAGH